MTFTKSDPRSIREHMRSEGFSSLPRMVAQVGMTQSTVKGAGFIVFDLEQNRAMEIQEGSLQFGVGAAGWSAFVESGIMSYYLEKSQMIYRDQELGRLDTSDFDLCVKDRVECIYSQ